MFVASVEDRYDIANVLLRHGAKVNVQDKHGHTALGIAVLNGFTGIVDLLLQKNADINVKNEVSLSVIHAVCSLSIHYGYTLSLCLKKRPTF